MTILFISIAAFLLTTILDYRSSLGGWHEENAVVRASDGGISKTKFFLISGVSVGLCVASLLVARAINYPIEVAAVPLVIGSVAHLWAMVHNNKVKKA